MKSREHRRKIIGGIALALVAASNSLPGRAAESTPVAPNEMRAPISLLFGDVELGLPLGIVDVSGHLRGFSGPHVFDLLRPLVVPDLLARLQAAAEKDGYLSVARLVEAGIGAEYNAGELSLRLYVPFELRTLTAVDVAARHPPLENVPIRPPADISAYVNLRAGDDYLSRSGAGANPRRQPAVVDLDGAFRLFDTALEFPLTYREQSADPWQRGDVRLVRDFPADRNRLVLGDLNYATTGFQGFQSVGGVAFARNFNLQPYRIAASTGEREFTLPRRSQVDVLVNGRRVRTLNLEAGRYNLRDLPLTTGTNNVAIRIVDEVGRVEVVQFPFVFDTQLLAEGEQDFSYAAGMRSRPTGRSKLYQRDDPVFSAFHAVGVTDYLTLGGNLQVMERQQIVGGEMRLGTYFGIFRFDTAMSNSAFAPTDFSGRLQYRLTEPSRPDGLNRNLLASLTYVGGSFAQFGVTDPMNSTAFDFGLVYGQKLDADWFGSAGFSIQFDRGSSVQSRTVDVSVGRSLGEEVFLDISGRRESSFDRETETSVFVTLSWIPFQSRHRVTVRRDSRERSTQVDWSYIPTEILGGVQANLGVEDAPRGRRIDGDLTYVDYRFEAQLRNDETIGNDPNRSTRTTGTRFATALVFADGHFGISRPISDSFVIVAPHAVLEGKTLEVNATGEQPQARTDFLGPAVLPRIASHYVQRVSVSVPDLPDGYDPGDQLVNVQPAYRSGTVVTVGTGATTSVEGILVDRAGTPIDLQIGSVVSVDNPDMQPRGFFTDASGRFQVTGLVAGKYRLLFDADPDVSAYIEVPADVTGIVKLGRVALTEATP